MSQFKNRVFGAPVDPKIVEEFSRLAGGQDRLPLQPIGAPKFENYLGDRIPFVRMWCAVNINDSIKSPEELGDTKNKYQKIERKDGGDFARGYDSAAKGDSSYFIWLNQGKESICLDLKEKEDKKRREHKK